MDNEIFSKIKQLAKKRSFEQLCQDLEIKDYELVGMIHLMRDKGELIDYIDGKIVVMKKPPRINDVYEVPNNLQKLKLLMISDTHLCSKYDRLDALKYLYDKADKLGVKHILHAGDFTDGRSNRPEQIYELREHSYEGQVDYCVSKYPKFDGKTYAIGGN